jgi:serine/threonine-protein kinase
VQRDLSLTLGARYRVVAEIASGGMGAINLALRVEADGTKRPVAIKQLHAHLASDPEIVAHFVDEARIASRIVHPNIVRLEDVEMIGNEIVIVMQYVEGVSLSVLLKTLRKSGETLPLDVIRRIVHDALLGLHAAHELRDANGSPLDVVHRDVSPHNVLVSVDGIARVTDFGIATAAGRVASTRTGGGVKGKLQYLSPEQIYRKPIDRRSDVFAAGTVLWECLTGRRLFSAPTEGETLAMVLREPIDPPSAHRPDVSLELDEACLRALERDPTRRFETAEELARAIEASGPLATREAVAAIVARTAPATIASRRSALEHAMQAADLGPLTPMAADAVEIGTPVSSRVPGVGPRPAPAAKPSRMPLVLALLVGLVAGGVAVGITARRTSAPEPVTSASLASAAPSSIVIVETTASSPAPAAPAPPPPTTTMAVTPAATPAVAAKSVAPSASSGRRTSAKKPPGGRPFMPNDL